MASPPRRDVDAFLPLRHSTYQVLLALSSGEKHGYGIMQELTVLTGGREKILPGTLYASLARMAAEGLIEELAHPEEESSQGPPRRYYRRTEFGKQVAAAESARLRTLLRVAGMQDLLPDGSR